MAKKVLQHETNATLTFAPSDVAKKIPLGVGLLSTCEDNQVEVGFEPIERFILSKDEYEEHKKSLIARTSALKKNERLTFFKVGNKWSDGRSFFTMRRGMAIGSENIPILSSK